jgi:cytochrome bd-type quinol oxidase subunit 2
MDGFDLGIGILFPRFPVGKERDQAMNSIAPVWDGNETWLVLGGGGLLAAFPLAYAIVLPALYAPLTAMLLAWCSAGSRSSSAGAIRGIGGRGMRRSSADRSSRPLRKG